MKIFIYYTNECGKVTIIIFKVATQLIAKIKWESMHMLKLHCKRLFMTHSIYAQNNMYQ